MKSFHSLLFQDNMSPMMLHISSFHDHVMMIMLMILSCVLYIISMIFIFPCYGRFFKSNETLEGLWTVIPCLILGMLAAPSLMTLYLSDEVPNPLSTLKIIGHQWFWSYEYDGGYLFDSYMTPTHSLGSGEFRLLEVDKSVFFPLQKDTRLIVTSSDVIHSWCIPSLGVKMDAVPGRLNQFYVHPSRVGIMYGQCSEICGTLHSFMPIKVEVVPVSEFINLLI